jgi:hypothetical protein
LPAEAGEAAASLGRQLAERIGDPDSGVVLAVTQVSGQDFSAAHRAAGLDDRGVPVRELEPLARLQGAIKIVLVMSWTGKRRNDSMSRTAC